MGFLGVAISRAKMGQSPKLALLKVLAYKVVYFCAPDGAVSAMQERAKELKDLKS